MTSVVLPIEPQKIIAIRSKNNQAMFLTRTHLHHVSSSPHPPLDLSSYPQPLQLLSDGALLYLSTTDTHMKLFSVLSPSFTPLLLYQVPFSHHSRVTGFLFDEAKHALYLNYANTVIVRHLTLNKASSAKLAAETVFSLKPSCRNVIATFDVAHIDADTSMMCVMVGPSDICVIRLNHSAKTYKQAEIDLREIGGGWAGEGPTLVFVEGERVRMVNSKGSCLILNLDHETLTVKSSQVIDYDTSPIVPLLRMKADSTYERVPCQVRFEMPPQPESTTSKQSQAINFTSQSSQKRGRKNTMSITANLEEFLQTAKEARSHQRAATQLSGDLSQPRPPSSRTLFIKELQDRSHQMSQKIRQIEVSREARRLLRAAKAPANRQDDTSTPIHLYFPLCRTLDRITRVQRDLKLGFDLIRRDALRWTALVKALKKLHKLHRKHQKRIRQDAFQVITQTFKAQVSQDLAKTQLFREVQITKKNLLLKLKTFHALKIQAKKTRSRLGSVKLLGKLMARKLKAVKSEGLARIMKHALSQPKREVAQNTKQKIIRPHSYRENGYNVKDLVALPLSYQSSKIGLHATKKEVVGKYRLGRRRVKTEETVEFNESEEEHQKELGQQQNWSTRPGHRPSQLSISYIVPKSQEEQEDHQTLDDEEDQALFKRLFEKYHQEYKDKQGQGNEEIIRHMRLISQGTSNQTVGIFSQCPLSPTSPQNLHRELQSPDDSQTGINQIAPFQPGQVFDYKVPQHSKPNHYKRHSAYTKLPQGPLSPAQLADPALTHSISNIEECKIENEFDETNMRGLAYDMQNLLSDKRGDFSFSIDHERGIIGIVNAGESGGLRNSQQQQAVAGPILMIPLGSAGHYHRRKQMSVVQSRNSMKPDPGLVLLNSKQERERAALNELNEILNDRILSSNRDEKHIRVEDNAGYYETLGIHRVNPHHPNGFNPQLEQETANFNREDWINSNGGQHRSASSRSNNPVRAEKTSVTSRISLIHLSNGEHRQSPFHQVHGSTIIQETCEFEEGKGSKTSRSKSSKQKIQSPPKVYPTSIDVTNDYYKPRGQTDDSELIQDGLLHQSHYANFSQDFISPDELNRSHKRSARTLSNNTPRNGRQTTGSIGQLQHHFDGSGATTPAQQSAFELFRHKLNTNLQNLRSQSQSRAVLDSIDNSNETLSHLNGGGVSSKHQRSKSYSQSLSEPKDDGFQSKRVSLNNNVQQNQGSSSLNLVLIKPRIAQSSIVQQDGPGSAEFMASVFQQLQAEIADGEVEQDHEKTMRYVEPFTQRASLTNLELAEPIDIGMGAQSSQSDSLDQSLLQEAQDESQRQSPVKESIIGQPSHVVHSNFNQRRFGFNYPHEAQESSQHNFQTNEFYQSTFGGGVDNPSSNIPLIIINAADQFDLRPKSAMKEESKTQEKSRNQQQFKGQSKKASLTVQQQVKAPQLTNPKANKDQKRQSMLGQFTKTQQNLSKDRNLLQTGKPHHKGKAQDSPQKNGGSMTFGGEEDTLVQRVTLSDRPGVLNTYASIKTTDVIVELTEEAESSMTQNFPARDNHRGELSTLQNQPIQFFNFMPVKCEAQNPRKPTQLLNYTLGGQNRPLSLSVNAKPKEKNSGPKQVKKLSPKKEPLGGDFNQDIFVSRESFRSTFEELRLSTDGLSLQETFEHPNFFEMQRPQSQAANQPQPKSGQQIMKARGEPPHTTPKHAGSSKTAVQTRLQSPSIAKPPFSPNNPKGISMIRQSLSSSSSNTQFDARRISAYKSSLNSVKSSQRVTSVPANTHTRGGRQSLPSKNK